MARSCCNDPCDGSPCHWECVVSEDVDCDCHCGGRYHGWGSNRTGTRQTLASLRNRREPARIADKLREVRARKKARRTAKDLAPELRELTPEQLDERFRAMDWNDRSEVAAVSREYDRRDREAKREAERAERAGQSEQRRKSRRQAEHDEWYLIADTELTEATNSELVKGEVFSRRGAQLAEKRGITEVDLWRMSRDRADVYASDELKEWWDRHDGGHRRTTPGDVRRQRAANARYERELYDAAMGSPYPGLYPGAKQRA